MAEEKNNIPPGTSANDSKFNDQNNPMLQGTPKDNAHAHRVIDENLKHEPIPQQTYVAPKVNFNGQPSTNGQMPPGSANGQPQQPLSEEEQKTAIEATAEFFINQYSNLHLGAKFLTKIDEDKLNKEIQDGKVDGIKQFPIDLEGTMTTLPEATQESNKKIDEILVVSQKFRDDVKPPLKRIIKKYGWIMTDELILAGILLEDAGKKAAGIYAIRKSWSIAHAYLRISDEQRIANNGGTQNTTTTHVSPPPPPPAPDYEVQRNGKDDFQEAEVLTITTTKPSKRVTKRRR